MKINALEPPRFSRRLLTLPFTREKIYAIIILEKQDDPVRGDYRQGRVYVYPPFAFLRLSCRHAIPH